MFYPVFRVPDGDSLKGPSDEIFEKKNSRSQISLDSLIKITLSIHLKADSN